MSKFVLSIKTSSNVDAVDASTPGDWFVHLMPAAAVLGEKIIKVTFAC